MISAELRREIEAYALRMRRAGDLFRHAERGLLTPDSIAYYVANLRVLVEHTPHNLALARDCARERGHHELADHYAHKMGEEEGHDRWAENDLSNLRQTFAVSTSTALSPAIEGLIAYLRDAIRTEPTSYLTYILFAEYVTVLVGPELLAVLERRCGIPRTSMTVVGHHVELDKGHVEEGLKQIDALTGGGDCAPAMRETLGQSMAYFDRFCGEICEMARRGAPFHATA
jgi:hypothetical protein